VQLQQKLRDHFDRTLDKKDAVKTTFKMFTQSIGSGESFLISTVDVG